MAMTSNIIKGTVAHNLSIAFAVIGLVIGGEYFFRHYVLFWLPTIGTLMVNDMLALLLVYALLTLGLGLIMQVHWEQELVGVARALREGASNWGFTIWVLALVLSLAVLSQVDYWLWGRLHLPMIISSYRNSTVWLAGLAATLKIVSRLVVNGLFVPVAEEYLWRGLVQVRLLQVFSVPVAIGLTAVFFFAQTCAGRCVFGTVFGSYCLWSDLRSGCSPQQLEEICRNASRRQYNGYSRRDALWLGLGASPMRPTLHSADLAFDTLRPNH